MKDLNIKKLYYSISEVSRVVGEEHYVLRYWETEFDQLKPQKNRAGNRIYTKKDIAVIETIRTLLRKQRYTIDGAKEIMKRYDPNTGEIAGLEEPLEEMVPQEVEAESKIAESVIIPLGKRDLIEIRDTLKDILKIV